MDIATIKKDLENQIGSINKELKNIYLPLEAVLILLGKRTAFQIALDLIDSLQQEQKPAEWSEEDEKAAYFINQFLEYHEASDPTAKSCKEWFNNRLKSLRPQPREEIYQSAKHDLAIKFMNYLDENRPEGKMNLSNGECEDIDKAFQENDWAKILRYIEKYGK